MGPQHPDGLKGFDFAQFCAEQAIDICEGLEARVAGERGNGIYTTKKICEGQRVMKVPTVSLYTIECIPETWPARKVERIAVHALLAAHHTFGPYGDIMWDFHPWIYMWPKLSDFTMSMPMFWPEKCRSRIGLESAATTGNRSSFPAPTASFAILPPPLTGAWLPKSADFRPPQSGSTSLVSQQTHKLNYHLLCIATLLPEHASSLKNPYDPKYWSFIHNWCSVNTRCFYYTFPGQEKPTDPNEAMAMCPGMDMFNHTDGSACVTKYDRTGYSVIADRDYEPGDEVLLSYGVHNNDVLWAEYGFLLDENCADALRIDRLVLDDLSDRERDLLAEYGYLGECWLQKDGVCYMTEVAAKVTVLSEEEWIRMVQEGIDPTDPEDAGPQVKRKANGVEIAVRRDMAFRKVKRKEVEWVLKAKAEAETSLRGLIAMTSQQLLDTFADEVAILKSQGMVEEDIASTRSRQASQRRAMCVKRWRQIWEMCTSALRSIEDDCTGSFVTGDMGRTEEELSRTIEDFLD